MTRTAIPVILGATATGKTSVGIELAKFLNGEIISVDSRKVYRGLPIGTATPAGQWINNAYQVDGVAHHLMAHLSPNEFYTAGNFAKDADQLIKEIFSRGKTPLLVGGTGFYFKALYKGLPRLPPRDEGLREKLSREALGEGLAALHARLEKIDPIAAKNISSRDTHKIIRALEVAELTGQPFSSWKNLTQKPEAHHFAVMGLRMPAVEIDARIIERSHHMLKQGMIGETERLLKEGYSKSCAALSGFGYKEAVQVIEGKLSREEFLQALIKGTKAYAKRQRTWFRTQINPHWWDMNRNTPAKDIAMKMKDFLDILPTNYQ